MTDGEEFELYDLRVEVTAPEGGPIYCGAKPVTISRFVARCSICRRAKVFPSIRWLRSCRFLRRNSAPPTRMTG